MSKKLKFLLHLRPCGGSVFEAGANVLVAGSAIFEARDVKMAIEELRQR